MKHLMYIIAAFVVMSSCAKSKLDSKKNNDAAISAEKPLNKYVYVDYRGCIHSKLDCIVFFLDSSNYSVKRYAISEYELSPELRYCSRCVSDDIYEQLITETKDTTSINY